MSATEKMEEVSWKVDQAIKLINDNKIVGTESNETNENGVVTVSDLSFGYYLIVETTTPTNYVASKPFFVAIPSANNYNDSNKPATGWVYDINVEPKNEKIPPIEKDADVTSAELGQIIYYTVTGPAVPTYDQSYDDTTLKYTITDILSKGLTFEGNTTIKVYKDSIDAGNLLELTNDYTLTDPVSDDNGTTISISLTQQAIKVLADHEIIVTYSAKVNENAVVGKDAITNAVKLEYTNSPNTTFEGDPITNKVYSFQIKVNKTGDDGKALEGAKFGLYRDQDCTEKIAEATSGKDGAVVFKDTENKEIILDEGTYYLKELSAPNGYTILATPFEVTIKDNTENDTQDYDFSYSLNNEEDKTISDDGIITVNVRNNKGFSLPSTGGAGTYLFTIGGIVIMAGAAFALIAMKKRA